MDVSRSSGQQLLWLQGERYVKERALFKALIHPSMTIVDVGANIGYYALMFSSLLHDNGMIVCLEPDPDNLRELRTNISRNRLDNIVAIRPVAAGASDGTAMFEAGSNGRIVPEGSIEVPIVAIDSLGLPKVNFLKIDVEGYEGSVLDGARKTIEQDRPTLFLELHPRLLTDHTHRDVVLLVQKYYSRVTVYRVARGNMLLRFLRDYDWLSFLVEVKEINALSREYELGKISEPCWIVARP
jgi:FkbM family methyltransferase